MFYHNVLLLSSCCAFSNTYTRGESALAFSPSPFSHSCVLLTLFFFCVCWVFLGGVFCKIQKITGWEKTAAIRMVLFKTGIPPERCSGLGQRVLPPARSRGSLLQCSPHSAPFQLSMRKLGAMRAGR